jgi:hypothetical protein
MHNRRFDQAAKKDPFWNVFAGRILFALGLIGLGAVGFIVGDFIVGRPPTWSERYLPPGWIIYLSNALLMLAGFAILLQRMILQSGLLLGVLILLLSLSRHFPIFFRDWTNAFKDLALFGGSLIVACSGSTSHTLLIPVFSQSAWKNDLFYGGMVMMAVFFLSCGYAHFKFADFVMHYIPGYIPFHFFWAYFCGICLLAAGLGFFIPKLRRRAAFLSGLMVLSWFLLVHIPRTITNPASATEAMGLFESLSFSGILLVISGLTPRPT